MERALKLKWNCCSKYRQALMSTKSMVIAEATQDDFWGVGVAPNLAEHTKPSKFLGLNQLGRLHMKLPLTVKQRLPLQVSHYKESIVVSVLLIGHLGNQGLKGVIHAQQGRM